MDPPAFDPRGTAVPGAGDSLAHAGEQAVAEAGERGPPDVPLQASLQLASWARWFDGLHTADAVLRQARRSRLGPALARGEEAAAHEALGLADQASRLDDRQLLSRWVMTYYLHGAGARQYDLFAVLMALRVVARRTLSEITQQRFEAEGLSTAGEREIIRKRVRAVFSRALRNRYVVMERVSDRQTFFSLTALGQIAVSGHLSARVGYALLLPHRPLSQVCDEVAEDEFPGVVRESSAAPAPQRALQMQQRSSPQVASLTQFFSKIVATRAAADEDVPPAAGRAGEPSQQQLERAAQLRESHKVTNRARSSRWLEHAGSGAPRSTAPAAAPAAVEASTPARRRARVQPGPRPPERQRSRK